MTRIYYCKKCDRYTDIWYVADKDGGRPKSYCYKCGNEMLEPVDTTHPIVDKSSREKSK